MLKHGLFMTLAGAAIALSQPAQAQQPSYGPPAPPKADTAPIAMAAPTTPPRLLVVISVDQFSADVFATYRPYFTGGLKRLEQGIVFPKGYQSHAATETCPGHSTILTGNRPGHTGIIANNWFDLSLSRAEKSLYCSEDPDAPGATARDYVVSNRYLRVPTLGGRMKAANPAARAISVAGKDRAAIMMGGKTLDQIWWWGGKDFVSYRGTAATPLVAGVNAGLARLIAQDRPAMDVPEHCRAFDYPVPVTDKMSVGTGHFARKAGDMRAFRISPEYDAAVLVLAQSLIEDQKLGQGAATDLISIGLSATDYVGHAYGSQGAEMCLQVASLDRELGAFFDRLDKTGVDYMVALTADHGGQDATERQRMNGIVDAERADPALSPGAVNEALAARTGLSGTLIYADGPSGDIYVSKTLKPADRARVLKEATALYSGHRQIAAVFTHADLVAAPAPSGPPESWSLLAMAKASFDPERSGDLVVLIKPRILGQPGEGYAAGHGTPWDYDRRVPILFWRKGLAHFEQPMGVETVDILPTLAAQIGLAVPKAEIDGRCLDLSVGAPSSCPAQ